MSDVSAWRDALVGVYAQAHPSPVAIGALSPQLALDAIRGDDGPLAELLAQLPCKLKGKKHPVRVVVPLSSAHYRISSIVRRNPGSTASADTLAGASRRSGGESGRYTKTWRPGGSISQPSLAPLSMYSPILS